MDRELAGKSMKTSMKESLKEMEDLGVGIVSDKHKWTGGKDCSGALEIKNYYVEQSGITQMNTYMVNNGTCDEVDGAKPKIWIASDLTKKGWGFC